ncbi:hypothetical protein [Streptomyces sp. NBC_01803]|uniref:hypothetical protein n=1 Tax=Streptomyces sp. NBC_01803 TaxID=2975946 RepID=UPI002DD91EE1|nr:hypothetical protein [Streptomyces sp. NBC_01803]WSA45900.1 hypothetical protein OIE51_17845 [Streptomyces sp. NBC_01803]
MSAGNAARRACAVLLAATAAAAAAGCGIRATDVPVDAGPAPTRASCDIPTEDTAGDGSEIYLVCGSRVQAVSRTVPADGDDGDDGDDGRGPESDGNGTADDDRVAVAEALLAELRADPTPDEQAAGLSSEVPAGLEVSGPVADDPVPALRLSQRPGDLSRVGLAQIVCTFANDEALGSSGETVMLGGPADSSLGQPRMYSCATAMRTISETGRSPLSPP